MTEVRTDGRGAEPAAAAVRGHGAAVADGTAADGAAPAAAGAVAVEAEAADGAGARVLGSADVDPRARLGAGTVVWHLAQVREDAVLGEECVVGRGAYVGPDVRLGDRVKLQNYALVYEPARLEDGVFVGPAAVLTNDVYPRATDPDGALKGADDWEARGVVVREGAAVGARAVVVAGVEVGRWALVAAGAVVTRDVPDHALVAGVPARRVKWVGRAGIPLEPGPGVGRWRCPRTGEVYAESEGRLEPCPTES